MEVPTRKMIWTRIGPEDGVNQAFSWDHQDMLKGLRLMIISLMLNGFLDTS